MIRGSSSQQGPPTGDEQSALRAKEEKRLAAEAAVLWRKGDYQACSKQLELLSALRPADPHVETNKAAAAALLATQTAQDRVNGGALSQPVAQPFLLVLNSANVLYNSGQYAAALKLLRPVWHSTIRSRESLVSDDVVLGAGFLLLDLLFRQRRLSEAAGVLSELEARHEVPAELEKEDTEARVAGTPDAGQRDDSVHSGDFSQVSPSSLGSVDQAPKVVAGYNVSQLVLGYRAHLHMLTGNVKGAKRDIKQLLASGPHHNQALSLKGELEALRGSLYRAAKLVASHADDDLSGPERCQMLCNMGVIQHLEGKHHVAALCFRKALACEPETTVPLDAEAFGTVQLGVQWGKERTLLLYNAGLEAMHVKQLDTALSCFKACLGGMEDDSFLWLRMAECCVQATASGTLLDVAKAVSGANGQDECASSDGDSTARFGQHCAEEALRLFNVREEAELDGHLSRSDGDGNAPIEEGARHSQLQTTVASSEQSLRAQGRISALMALSYLCLHLVQGEAALVHADAILKIAEPSSQAWQIGQVYASEALCQTKRADQAAEHLQAALSEVLESSSSSAAQPQQTANGSMPEDGTADVATPDRPAANELAMKVLLCVNSASTYFALKDFPQALEYATTGAADTTTREAVLMYVYLQLCQGETDSALAQLRSMQLGATA